MILLAALAGLFIGMAATIYVMSLLSAGKEVDDSVLHAEIDALSRQAVELALELNVAQNNLADSNTMLMDAQKTRTRLFHERFQMELALSDAVAFMMTLPPGVDRDIHVGLVLQNLPADITRSVSEVLFPREAEAISDAMEYWEAPT